MDLPRLILAIAAGIAIILAVQAVLPWGWSIAALFVLGALFTWLGRKSDEDGEDD